MVRTRFAPSPTGYLHIGGVRTALFNWLFARRHGGRFILRIDDTDVKRNVAEALAPILEGFRWLGVDWDEGPEIGGDRGPYYQSQRHEVYSRAVDWLLAAGHAYHDYATPDELAAERAAAEKEKRRFIYSRRWAARSPEQRRKFEAEGRRPVVRLEMPREGVCRFTDRIRGEVEFEWALEQDHVVQRADGSCLYHLASAVDDHEMGITHVIRAEEHLSNTPRHIFIARGLGHEPPEYAHLPFVAEPGGRNKLSKRKLGRYLAHPDFSELQAHGRRVAERLGLEPPDEVFNPLTVEFYRVLGFLPEALLNYLLLLGWSLDDRTERFTRDEMIASFSLERVNRAPASLDLRKLAAFQERSMRELTMERKTELAVPYLERAGLVTAPAGEGERERARRVVAAAGDRLSAAGDILEYDYLFVADDRFPYDEQAFAKRLRKPPEAAALLAEFRGRLAAAEPFEAGALEELMRDWVEEKGIKLGQVIHAVRVAVSGRAVGFGLFDILEIAGRESCLARIDRALARLEREGAR